MNYFLLKKRISEITLRDDLSSLIGGFINEVRESVSRKAISVGCPFSFLLNTKSIPLVASTYTYKFDASGSTERYGGSAINVITYDNAVIKTDIYGESVRAFELFHATPSAGDTSVFTIKGDSFQVDKVPSVVTNKTYSVRYYYLPNKLSALSDEHYIDKKYYDMIIDGVCSLVFGLVEKEAGLFKYWSDRADLSFREAIYQDSGYRLPSSAESEEGGNG